MFVYLTSSSARSCYRADEVEVDVRVMFLMRLAFFITVSYFSTSTCRKSKYIFLSSKDFTHAHLILYTISGE